MTKRVVIVDDSSLSRVVLRKILEADGDILVVGEASDSYEASRVVADLAPDLVTMDIDMPGPNGLETIARLMQATPVPILVVTGERLGGGSDVGFRAIECGALDYMPKPSILDERAAATLRESVRVLASVPVFRHGSSHDTATMMPPGLAPATAHDVEIVTIASGAGGSRAVAAILSRLPASFPCTIAIAQHTQFGEAFARYLRTITPLAVSIVSGSYGCEPGEILVGGSGDLRCTARGSFSATTTETRSVRPANDLMTSIAGAYGSRAVGVVVSGHGEDGAEGLARLHAAGGVTIAEMPEMAMPAEMPRAATKTGVLDRSLPLELIADYLVAMVTRSNKTTAPPTLSSTH